jgi:hypothetical protein
MILKTNLFYIIAYNFPVDLVIIEVPSIFINILKN